LRGEVLRNTRRQREERKRKRKTKAKRETRKRWSATGRTELVGMQVG
jgi:hypothetical protein